LEWSAVTKREKLLQPCVHIFVSKERCKRRVRLGKYYC